MKYTPTPYWIDDDGFIASGNGESYVTIADTHCTLDIDTDQMDKNAEFIVTACNNHETMKLLLKRIVNQLGKENDNVVTEAANFLKELEQ